jgi:hypothetical protein
LGTPLPHFFSLFHLSLKWKAFFIWRSWLHFQLMVLVLHEYFFYLEIVASSSSHGSNFTRCLQTWIDKDNVLLQLQLSLLILLACLFMGMSQSFRCGNSGCAFYYVSNTKVVQDFILVQFDRLTLLMAPTIVRCAQSTCEHHIQILDLRVALKFLF